MLTRVTENKYGGPIHYFGSRFLSLPDSTGHMVPNQDWLKVNFEIFKANHPEKYQRCIEPFSGSATWSLAAMEVDLAEEYIINDSDEALINTLILIRDMPSILVAKYASLVSQYQASPNKKDFYRETINKYNRASHVDVKSVFLPFIINYAWGGIIYHNDNGDIVYKNEPVYGAPVGDGCLVDANLSIETFSEEIYSVSSLLRRHKVTFTHGDFSNVLQDVKEGDVVGMNPPYPDNMRFKDEQTGMYRELVGPEALHESIKNTVAMLEEKGVDYYMTYGIYSNENQAYLVLDPAGNRRDYFTLIGSETCALGTALDQLYFSSKFTIPAKCQTFVIPANRVLGGKLLSHDESMASYLRLSEDIANEMRSRPRFGF